MNEIHTALSEFCESDRLQELIATRAQVSAQIVRTDQELSEAHHRHKHERMALLMRLLNIDSTIAQVTKARQRAFAGRMCDPATNASSDRLEAAIRRRSELQICLGERCIAARLSRVEARRAADITCAQQLMAEAARHDEQVAHLRTLLCNVVEEILALEAEIGRGRCSCRDS